MMALAALAAIGLMLLAGVVFGHFMHEDGESEERPDAADVDAFEDPWPRPTTTKVRKFK